MTPRSKPESCIGCACHSHGTDFSAIEGTGSSGVMLVGEASGEAEQRDQLPFRPYAPAGGVLERLIRRMGLTRDQFWITNVVRCRPKNNWLENAPWEGAAIAHCRPNLESAIRTLRPRAIVALGSVAARSLTGMAGEALGVGHLAGYVLPGEALSGFPVYPGDHKEGERCVPVLPNFHPAYLRRGKASHHGVFGRILRRAVNIASGRSQGQDTWIWNIDPESEDLHARLNYAPRPSLASAESFSEYVLAHPQLVVSYDLETSESTSLDEDAREGFADTYIRLVQFAIDGRGAIALPWEPHFIPIIQRVLLSSNPKCGHNVWTFDNKVLRAAGQREGIEIEPRGPIHDTLAMFHHWQPDLPAHLQFAAGFVQFPFPWKHLAASDIAFYGCCDVDATLRLYHMLEATLKRDGLWGDHLTGYIGQVYEVRPVLAAMEDRGMPIDDAERMRLGQEFDCAQEQLGKELAEAAPAECSRVEPKGGFKKVPKEIAEWNMLDGQPIGDVLFRETETASRPLADCEYYRYARRLFEEPIVDDATGQVSTVPVERWCRQFLFNPNSSQQVKSYMRAKGHPIPTDKHREDADGNDAETTAVKELIRLANKTGDTFYLKVIEYRGLSKLKGTYVDGFKPGPDGCVHTTFTFLTGIGQLGSRNPNIQNFPKLKPTPALAKAMRRMVRARPGNVLVEWDFKSCHIITLGFLAEDLNYIRLGRLDMHSFVAGHFLGHWDGLKLFQESDAELLARFKWLKSDPERKRVRDDQAKHGILGIGNGLKAKGLFERYMESFPPSACAECRGQRVVAGARAGRPRRCPTCKGSGMQSGMRTAERVLEVAGQLFPNVFRYQKVEAKAAHEQQQLVSAFRHVRRFYEVFRYDARRMDMVAGDQHEQAIAFRLANIAFGHIREKLKQLAAAELDAKYGLFNNVHDSFLFHFPRTMLDEHVAEVYPILVAPSQVLRSKIAPEGLVIGVEGAVGECWAEMEELKAPVQPKTSSREIVAIA